MHSIFLLGLLSTAIATLVACASHSKGPVSVCTYEGATKQGIADAQDGRTEQAMQIAGGCEPSVRSAVEKWYRQAFNTYDGVEASMPKTAAVTKTDMTCKRKSDCPETKWCRNRGDGVWLCLGNENHDGYCEYEDDCGFGLLCRKGKDKVGRCE